MASGARYDVSDQITSNRIRIKKYGTGSDLRMLSLQGDLVVVGKSPDGDSIRFIPRTPALLRRLNGGSRVDPSSDGSVQLRLDGIDAPEVHYNGLAQPLAEPARADLLAWCGFRDVRWSGEQVSAATPARVPAAVLSSLVDPNGRPIVLLLRDAFPPDGADVEPDVERTANFALAASGAAYGTFYETTASRATLTAAAVAARTARRGVWARDATAGFSLDAIGPSGAPILPKLFRRCSDFVRAGAPGTLPEWLRRRRGEPNSPDDRVLVDGEARFFSDLLRQDGRRISLLADPLDLVFVD
jgi:endonuclease YncB( thermonuclease family)